MKSYRILVTGANGQLGSEIRAISNNYPEFDFFFTTRLELDICDQQAVEEYVALNNINSMINCAAYTAVDKAESEPELTDKINHLAGKGLAEIAKKFDISLIHISTDYVFDGKGYKPYPVDHPTAPINVYGKTKLDGEKAFRKINPKNSMIIRTSWVYSSFGNNFVKTMLRLGAEREELNVICDQIGTPTYARDLAEFILKKAVRIKNENVETYHFSNEGVCSWYDFAKEIMLQADLNCKVYPIPTNAYPTPAKRPYYSLMDKTAITKVFNYNIPNWKESLSKCVTVITFKNTISAKED
jgi:dTDP-4-dehydrorhamnose reductase